MTNYYSERIELIEHIITDMQKQGMHDKNSDTSQDYKALQLGFISDFVQSEYQTELAELENHDKSVEPTQIELCSYGNFFEKYPQKTVGKKFLASSFMFAVQSKATLKENIEMLKKAIQEQQKNGVELWEMSDSEFVNCLRITTNEKGHTHIFDCKGSGYLAFTPESTSGKEYASNKKAFLHKFRLSIIQKAIREGKKIPQSILNDYPELTNPSKLKLKMKAKALKLLQLQAQAELELNGLSGLDGVLGALGEVDKKAISINKDRLASLILKEDNNKKIINSFDDNFKRYNKGITEAEIKAWVWFKQSQGSPMYGWEKYFIKSTGKVEEVLVATKATVIKDNHFRDEATVPSGSILGKPTRFTNEYDKKIYQVFTDREGNKKFVNKAHVKTKRTGATANQTELDKLIQEGALFFGEADFLPLPLYTFGNIYDKLLALEKQKERIVKEYGQAVYEHHLRVLNEAKPRQLSVLTPEANRRLRISVFSDFALKFMVREDAEGNEVNQSIASLFEDWLKKNADLIEVEGIHYSDIISVYINGRSKRQRETAEEWIFLKKFTREEGERLFDVCLHTGISVDDQQKLDMSWNRQFNGFASLNYKRIPIGLETSALFKGMPLAFMEAQREAIAFIDAVGSGCLAYDVGVGKTLALIIILAQNIQNGTYKRPLIVVPKPTYQKWINEIIGYTDKDGNFVEGILSNLNIKINAFENLGVDVQKKNKNINSLLEEGSITIITYQGFEKIGFSERLEDELLYELSKILLFTPDDESARDKEKQFEKLREEIGRAAKKTVVDIDVWGIDAIAIDEAHNCRNIFKYVPAKEGVKRFDMKSGSSLIGKKAFILCNYVQRKHGGNIILLTATPFNNSPLEVYNMLSLIALNKMSKVGVDSIVQFMETFIIETIETVVSSTNKLTQKAVVKSFQNKRSLQSLVFNYINFKSGEDAGVRRPVKINLPRLSFKNNEGKQVHLEPKEQLTTYLKMNAMQEQVQKRAVAWAESGTNFKEKGTRILQAMMMSRKNAFSPFLDGDFEAEDYLDFVDNSPKIKYTVECIRSVKEHHNKNGTPISGQVIYSNVGIDYFNYIKEYLEEEIGFKKKVKNGRATFDEVEIIAGDENKGDRREAVKDAFLAGVVKVIIGSQTIREGIDLQKKGTVLYNLYPDYNPTDIRQLEGRIWRQGNKFGYVRIVMPLVQDSLDVFIFQKLEEKTARINDIWSKADDSNVLDQESLNPEAVKYALFTDIDKLVSLKLDEIRLDIGKSSSKLERELEALGEVEAANNLVNVTKKFCLERIDEFERTVKELVSQNEKTKDKEIKKQIKKSIEALEKIAAFDREDGKELISVCRKILTFDAFEHTFRKGNYAFGEDMFSLFRLNFSKIKKSEAILYKYDDLSDAIRSLKDSLAEQAKKLENLFTEESKKEIYKQIVEDKKKLNINGRNPKEASKDFASLNYLLDYKMADVDDVNGNPLPTKKPQSTKSIKLIPPTENKTKIKLKMKAKALKLLQLQAKAELELAA